MTRWGILADVHGNRPALDRALAAFHERRVTRIAVLGDNLGRGDSDGCVEVIRRVADVSVVGNRDLDWKDRVSPTSAAYVLGLPRVAQADGVVFSHGDARLTRDLSSNEVRAGFRRAQRWLLANGCRAWLFGHTHRARIWSLDEPDTAPRLHFDAATDPLPALIRLRDGLDEQAGRLWIVNAGSVGLPFPGKGPASATIFDASAGIVAVIPL